MHNQAANMTPQSLAEALGVVNPIQFQPVESLQQIQQELQQQPGAPGPDVPADPQSAMWDAPQGEVAPTQVPEPAPAEMPPVVEQDIPTGAAPQEPSQGAGTGSAAAPQPEEMPPAIEPEQPEEETGGVPDKYAGIDFENDPYAFHKVQQMHWPQSGGAPYQNIGDRPAQFSLTQKEKQMLSPQQRIWAALNEQNRHRLQR